MAHITLDTQIVVNNRRESLFYHLEHNNIEFVMVANYDYKKDKIEYCAILKDSRLHWKVKKDSYMRYTERKKRLNPEFQHTNIDFNSW